MEIQLGIDPGCELARRRHFAMKNPFRFRELAAQIVATTLTTAGSLFHARLLVGIGGLGI
jgi:hypothetical protein